MNENILRTAIENGITVTHVDVGTGAVTPLFTANWTSLDPEDLEELEDNVNTAELQKLNGTPFPDSREHAYFILDRTLAEGGGTFVYEPRIEDLGLSGGWNEYQGDGYAVGGYQDTVLTQVPTDAASERLVTDVIAHFIERIPSRGDGSKHYLLGTWVQDGTIHVDAVTVWATLDDALLEGQRLHQYSVYSFNEAREYVCDEYEVVGGEVYEKATGLAQFTTPFPEAEHVPLDGILTTIVEEGAVFVKLDDVIAEIETWREVNERSAQYHRNRISESLDAGEPDSKRQGYFLCISDSEAQVREDNWIIKKLREKFGK